ncbi:MAG: GNAT family N-acetyltransferase [Flavobacteriia bacterium]|nr:GNAT family N-acetyltransferase [Flavobacteriia bacterium]OJX39049.1 MAG: hemolysin [Flavobacteriia bacterium 40-80]
MKQEEIIPAVDVRLLKTELNSSTFLRKTRKGDNEIYCVNIHNAPNVVREIGRLREITFRDAGGGTGKSLDLDEFDTNEICYDQLVLWSPEDEEIIGGYRYILCQKAIQPDSIHLSTTHYFHFSDEFINEYLPFTIELGRSWIQPKFQPSNNPKKGLFALDNIFDGLGGLVKQYPEIRYFFGKFTMYPSYATEARNYLLEFLNYYFPDEEKLVTPVRPLKIKENISFVERDLEGLEYKEGYKKLNAYVKQYGEFIPPLVSVYMSLSPTMKTFGTCINEDFGGVEETGILIKIEDIYEEKKERHLQY